MSHFKTCVSVFFLSTLGVIGILLLDYAFFSSYFIETIFNTRNSNSILQAAVHQHQEEQHAVALSRQALQNIGISDDTIQEIVVSSYDKTMSFPAILVDRPGRSTFRIPAPFSGVIKKIYVEPGMIVQPGQALFDVSLTHEDLISCQNELISLFQKRDTIQRELERLQTLAMDIAPKTKRDTEFQKMEIDSQIETQRSILHLHGINNQEIQETIEKQRKLIAMITVLVPEMEKEKKDDSNSKQNDIVQMESLFVSMGQSVSLGDPLCQLADLSLLNIEGRASTNDETILATALLNHCNVIASFDHERVDHLQIRYIDTRIDSVSRALKFYVELPNSVIVKDEKLNHHHSWSEGLAECDCETHRHYVNWRFRPGQRCELKVEYDTIPSCIVVPREAVAESGSEASLFEWTGIEPDGEQRKIWTKRPIHILHRSKTQVAIANDGSIFPGAKIATRGAGQLLVALTSGGGQLQSACPCGEH